MPFLLPLLADVAILSDVIQIIGYAGVIGGTVGNWCRGHSCAKRDVAYLESVPRINVERQDVGPCNIPMYNFQICSDQLHSQSVVVASSIPAPGVAQFDNIPPACMNLAAVLGGSCTGEGPRPTPCGSACMQYTGLSDAQFEALAKALA